MKKIIALVVLATASFAASAQTDSHSQAKSQANAHQPPNGHSVCHLLDPCEHVESDNSPASNGGVLGGVLFGA
jgi:hypothetical protein